MAHTSLVGTRKVALVGDKNIVEISVEVEHLVVPDAVCGDHSLSHDHIRTSVSGKAAERVHHVVGVRLVADNAGDDGNTAMKENKSESDSRSSGHVLGCELNSRCSGARGAEACDIGA